MHAKVFINKALDPNPVFLGSFQEGPVRFIGKKLDKLNLP